MNRAQRREVSKDKDRIDVSGIVVHFQNGQYVNLDTSKAMVVDKDTGRPLFEEILEAKTPQQEFKGESNSDDNQTYAVEFETPEGTMIYSKNGNWSGVKKK